MKRKPWSLVVLALLHIVAPFGNLLLNASLKNRTFAQQWHYWFDILPKQLLLIYVGLPILAGVFIFICRRWSYWAYLGCIGIIFLSNVYSYWTSMSASSLVVLVALVIIDVLVVAYFVVPSVQNIYFDPRLRWWEAAPRYNFNVAGTVSGHEAFITNLSQGGVFLTTSASLKEGDQVQVSWNFEQQSVQIPGVVLYRADRKSNLGYGVRFDHTAETQKQVRVVVDSLHNKNLIVVERLPGPEDSFAVWLKKLFVSGEGLFPKGRS